MVFFTFGAFFFAATLLVVFFTVFFFEAGFVFFLAGFLAATFAAFSSLAVNCLTRFSADFTSFRSFLVLSQLFSKMVIF